MTEDATSRPPQGQRFSQVYVDRGEPTQDSVRMRRRIAVAIRDGGSFNHLAKLVEHELGVSVPWHGREHDWVRFLTECDLRDALDVVTVAFKHLIDMQRIGGVHSDGPPRFLRTINRIFAEENVHYRVDDQGGVHFHFDEAFARNRAAAIAALQADRYANANHAFEEGMAALRSVPPNGKGAIRGVFGAAETIFRLILPNVQRLAAAQLDGLVPLLQQAHREDTARRSAAKMLSSLKGWVDAAHFYHRHEQGTPDEVVQPPLGLAVYIVSTGASHVRWLAELDAFLLTQGASASL
jgi:hypothetical protein